ncbi:gamma-glutamyl hercynylcysteine S-oxide hydrolase [Fistulifera solaris]|uniref:Gamma-glutamyl hercynylcysteine S-oxide hydrolase n=1 Tax=Fistulifera solaris TaxID=1519565 RepID=A0A1Z5JQD4_FISSO|nr:gamma-glutamyl hercynylcysteine S-oxide hydrolase [Fistulifera solaris]|eukprot:GAX15978.1 gamma-glutamyl hercynylcysteine S-oxide hydrolase [Fistulifera solaris]
MCQLLGMNCAAPTDFSFSLKGFCQRGGKTDKHSHGFGLAIYEGRGVRCFHDTLPACQSPIADLVQKYPIKTYNMMAHIRYATQGAVSLENVHPFVRVWKGITMSFCHNGDCPSFANVHTDHFPALGMTRDRLYHPVGDTDSEAVFCAILNALHAEFPDGLPSLPVLHEFLSDVCQEIVRGAQDTIFNFLLGCGPHTLFAYSWPGRRPGSDVWNGLHYIVREPPFSTAKLLDVDYTIDFSTVATEQDRVAVITTKPLTQEEGWREFGKGELIMFDQGLPYRTSKCCEIVENLGRGLSSKCFGPLKCGRSPRLLPQTPRTAVLVEKREESKEESKCEEEELRTTEPISVASAIFSSFNEKNQRALTSPVTIPAMEVLKI